MLTNFDGRTSDIRKYYVDSKSFTVSDCELVFYNHRLCMILNAEFLLNNLLKENYEFI